MAIIVVGGSTRGAGKTALVCALIRALPDMPWMAIKISSHEHGERKPVWEETQAGEETDTARYLAAGAARAFLVSAGNSDLTTESDLACALDELWPNFGRGSNLFFESNRVVHHVRPNVCLMIHAVPQRALPLPERKPSFIAALAHADAMVALAAADGVIPDRLRLPGQDAKPIFNLMELGKISPQMMEWLRPRLGSMSRDLTRQNSPRADADQIDSVQIDSVRPDSVRPD